MRELASSREKYRLDQASRLKYAERQGIEKGIEQGKIEVVRNAINKGIDVEVIADLTGLTKEKVKNVITNTL